MLSSQLICTQIVCDVSPLGFAMRTVFALQVAAGSVTKPVSLAGTDAHSQRLNGIAVKLCLA